MSPGLSFHGAEQQKLEEPTATTPEQRRRARITCAEQLDRDDLPTVLQALGLIAYREET